MGEGGTAVQSAKKGNLNESSNQKSGKQTSR